MDGLFAGVFRLDVFAHNMETVERLTPFVRDTRAKYRQSLKVLRRAKMARRGKMVTKTSIMLGLGNLNGPEMSEVFTSKVLLLSFR